MANWTPYYWVWTKDTGVTGMTHGVQPPVSGWGANFKVALCTSDKGEADEALRKITGGS